MNLGDYVKIHGLVDTPHLNDLYAEVMEVPQVRELPTKNGPLEAEWCGVFILGPRLFGETGYVQPKNLQTVATAAHERRAINIHLFGTEEAPE